MNTTPAPSRTAPATARTTEPAIRIQGLTKHFGPVHAVDGIDLTVQPGEVLAFLGPNGAGKTTTLDVLLGLTDATSGTVKVLGGTPRAAVNAGRIAAVLQTGGLLRDVTVEQTVRTVASFFGATARVPEVMERADLTRIARRRVGKCSGGEQQRVKFALALVPDPDVLILDEPTAGMDVTARQHFWEAIQADADAGRTIVFATHFLQEAEQYAARTVLMAGGRIVADAPTHRLRESLGSRKVAATVPSGTVMDAVERLTALPGVADVAAEPIGGDGEDATRITLTAQDADGAARLLLTDLPGRDLEVVAPSLETAFTTLTTQE